MNGLEKYRRNKCQHSNFIFDFIAGKFCDILDKNLHILQFSLISMDIILEHKKRTHTKIKTDLRRMTLLRSVSVCTSNLPAGAL